MEYDREYLPKVMVSMWRKTAPCVSMGCCRFAAVTETSKIRYVIISQAACGEKIQQTVQILAEPLGAN